MDRHERDADRDRDDGFTDFMSECAHRLHRVAYLLTGDAGQAEELTQAALVRTYTAWRRIRRDDAYAYARRVLVNQHNDWWRGRLRRERLVPDVPERSTGDDRATTGKVRTLESGGGAQPGSPPASRFGQLAQLDDRAGGIVDYGLFHGDAARITVDAGGRVVGAHLAHWSRDRSFTVFWVRRTGTLLSPTPAPEGAGGTQPRFTAYNEAGEVLGTSDGQESRRSDGGVNAEDRERVGDVIRTGTPVADGRELVLWFVGDDQQAILKAGARDRAGTIAELKLLGNYHRPPFDIGFYHGLQTIDGPGGKQIVLCTYVGPAARVVAGSPAAGVTHGFGRWSAHPELFIVWVAGVPPESAYQTTATAYDVQGTMVAASNFR